MNLDEIISSEEYFKTNLDSNFTCYKCHRLLLNAYQSSCGCFRCCETCITSNICHICDSDITFYPDKAFSKQLHNTKLNCVFSECKTKVQYGNYMNHITNCDFRLIECNSCHEIVAQCKLNEHRKHQCESLEKRCDKCKKVVKFSQTKHIEFDTRNPPDCDGLYGDCPNCVAKNILLKTHYQTCMMIPCLLAEYGCRGYIQVTKCTDVSCHVRLIDNVIKTFLKDVETISSFTKSPCDDKAITKFKSEIESLEKEVETIQGIFKRSLEFYATPKRGKLVWVIPDAKRMLDNRSSIMSDSIYSDEYGYKLCLKIYPRGDGVGRDEYFSVYYVIMKGAYDELLPWPFNKKVKITLFNPIDMSKSKSELYKPGHLSHSTERPKTAMNIATGNPRFISLDEILHNGFIVDEKIFIEISILNDRTFL